MESREKKKMRKIKCETSKLHWEQISKIQRKKKLLTTGEKNVSFTFSFASK